jgi:hypothetical protein
MLNGSTTGYCVNQRELRDTLKAITFNHPNFNATIFCREKAKELGTPWHVCQEDISIYVSENHVSRHANRIYVLGNGTVAIGYDNAVKVMQSLGIFTKQEAERYVQDVQ